MKPRVHVCIMMLFVLSACLLHAQVPRTMFYQGVLSDSTGAPKPDGSYSFTFRLYEASSGGSAVGTQQQTLQVKRGLFYTVFDQLLNGLTIDHPYWFTVQVQNEAELSPRIPFTSVPYSISSIRADTARYALSIASNTGWSLTGNAGTVSGTNFIGTTDDIPFTIRVNNQQAGRISSAGPTFLGYQAGNSSTDFFSVGVGYHALFSNTTGANNVANGYQALGSNTIGTANTASGGYALYANTSGSDNTASGLQALFSNTTGSFNTASGGFALYLNTSGDENTASGFGALRSNTTGIGNTASGVRALFSNTTGNTNTASGHSALYSNTTGVSNTASGFSALYSNTTGTSNTASGLSALFSNTNVTNTANGESALLSNTTGSDNTASGFDALHSNITGDYNTANGGQALYSNTTGSYNTASGLNTLYANSTGTDNTASGFDALHSNTAGDYNTADGGAALYSNTTGTRNTASGYHALYSNTTGIDNVANGGQALYFNTTGLYNTASGYNALNFNITGTGNTANGLQALYANNESYNTACGANALYLTTASQYNVAVGYNAGGSYDNGYNNTFVGANADVNGVGYYNVIAIGKGTVVTGPSAAVFGNSSTVSYSGYANWSNISDGRYKKNIRDNVPGLNFITKLRPVTYNLDATGLDAFLHRNDKEREQGSSTAKAIHDKALQEKEVITYTGFVAQEVEAAAKELGYDFSGVDAPRNENGTYGLRYAEFVMPLVKAVQEQQKEIEELKAMVKSLSEARK